MVATGQISNAQWIENFEKDADPSAPFHHADHVRLAFAYLHECPVFEALTRFSTALKRYAAARGKTQLYHETITWAYFFLIHERMARGGELSWEEFELQNPDLFEWQGGILNGYYAEGTLKSDLAKRIFVLPDKWR